MNRLKSIILVSIGFVLGFLISWQVKLNVLAEQSGSSPESDTDSYIKTAYDWLEAKGDNYGDTDAGDWSNDWGTWWNQIMEASAWEPGGDLALKDVFIGKTFYRASDDRTQKTGTLDMSLVEKDDSAAGDAVGEESTWTNTCPVASGNCSEDVYQDQRTGLYWSSSQGVADNNNFTISSCAFFSTEPRGDYDGSDSDCQDNPTGAINMCGLLSIDADDDGSNETDWYLPTYKEFMMAHIDGMYNQAGSTFTTTSRFWSSTEYSDDSTNAWNVYLSSGRTNVNLKTTDTYYVRCVRRD